MPCFVLSRYPTVDANLIAEARDEVCVATGEADAKDWAGSSVNEGDGKIAEGGEALEVGEDER